MKNILYIGVVIMFLFSGCDTPKNKIPSGVFYGVSGNKYLKIMNFKEDKYEIIKFSESFNPKGITRINNELLLLTFFNRDMKVFNIKTKEIVSWNNSRGNPIYFSKYNRIILGTFMLDFNYPEKEEIKIPYTNENSKNISFTLKISEDEVLYMKEQQGIWIYNLGTKEVKKISNFYCSEPFWRSNTNQLVCKDYKNNNFYLSSLDGNKTEIIELEYRFKPSIYLDDLDAVIGERKGIGFPDGKWEIWIYYFKKNKLYKLKRGASAIKLVRFN